MNIERHAINNREAWLELRRQDVTASEVAAVAGVSPYKSALKVWAEKSGMTEEGETDLMRRGRWLEPAVVQALREERPEWQIVYPVSLYLRDPDARIGATPDCFATTGDGLGNVQCKVIAAPVFEREWAGGPPLHYALQTLVEAKLAGCQWATLAVLVVDTFSADLKLFPVEIHDAAYDRIKRAVAAFWSDVTAGREPKADYARDGELLKMLRKPDEEKPPLDLTSDNRLAELLSRRERLMAERQEGNAELEATNAEIVDKLHGAPVAIAAGWKITNRTQTSKGYSVGPKSYSVLRCTRRGEA